MVYLRIELPVLVLPGRGATVLFDPIFGDKCLPSELLGPKRYTKPLKIENTPEVAAIVILVTRLFLDLGMADVLIKLNLMTEYASSFLILSQADLFYPSHPSESNHALLTNPLTTHLITRAYARLLGRSTCGDTRNIFQRQTSVVA